MNITYIIYIITEAPLINAVTSARRVEGGQLRRKGLFFPWEKKCTIIQVNVDYFKKFLTKPVMFFMTSWHAARPPQFKTRKREANRRPIVSWDRNHSTNERTPFTMCLPSLPWQWAAQCKQTVCRQTKSQYHKNHTFWTPAHLHDISFWDATSHFPLGTPGGPIWTTLLGPQNGFLCTPDLVIVKKIFWEYFRG